MSAETEDLFSVHLFALPPEIVTHIVSFLDFYTLNKLRLVCRELNTLCRSLMIGHLRRWTLNIDDYDITPNAMYKEFCRRAPSNFYATNLKDAYKNDRATFTELCTFLNFCQMAHYLQIVLKLIENPPLGKCRHGKSRSFDAGQVIDDCLHVWNHVIFVPGFINKNNCKHSASICRFINFVSPRNYNWDLNDSLYFVELED